jgi:hypothetical protein
VPAAGGTPRVPNAPAAHSSPGGVSGAQRRESGRIWSWRNSRTSERQDIAGALPKDVIPSGRQTWGADSLPQDLDGVRTSCRTEDGTGVGEKVPNERRTGRLPAWGRARGQVVAMPPGPASIHIGDIALSVGGGSQAGDKKPDPHSQRQQVDSVQVFNFKQLYTSVKYRKTN